MSKVKYYYDPDTLSYRKIEPQKSKRYRNIASFRFGICLLFRITFRRAVLMNTNLIQYAPANFLYVVK